MAPNNFAVARTVAVLREIVAEWRQRQERVALVPTMGALHRGHLALVETARRHCDRVVASLFVNPKQFGPREDFAAYPRDEAADLAKFCESGVDLAFAPTVEEMYPAGFVTTVHVTAIGDELEGAHRAGHFDGVATVVSKLLLQCLPDIAFFGEKDYQQLLVVRRMARDLDIPVRIEGVPTVREPDGLALSSRNVYLMSICRQRSARSRRCYIARSMTPPPRSSPRRIRSPSRCGMGLPHFGGWVSRPIISNCATPPTFRQ